VLGRAAVMCWQQAAADNSGANHDDQMKLRIALELEGQIHFGGVWL